MKRGCIALQWKRFQTIALVWNLFHWTAITRLWWFLRLMRDRHILSHLIWWGSCRPPSPGCRPPAATRPAPPPWGEAKDWIAPPLPLLWPLQPPRLGTGTHCFNNQPSLLPRIANTQKLTKISVARQIKREFVALCVLGQVQLSVVAKISAAAESQLDFTSGWILISRRHTGLLIIGCRHIYEGPPGQLIIVRHDICQNFYTSEFQTNMEIWKLEHVNCYTFSQKLKNIWNYTQSLKFYPKLTILYTNTACDKYQVWINSMQTNMQTFKSCRHSPS